MSIRVGTSGWQYREWRDPVYGGRAQRRWLSLYAERFGTVEVNSTFYRLPERSTFERWAAATPPDFRFAIKVSRYLTHLRRLREPAEPVRRFLERAAGLGDRLAVALVQLPPDMAVDLQLLEGLLAQWPSSVPLAVEFRHDSWFRAEVTDLLEASGVALCLTDRHERATTPIVRTADWCYLRLHEGCGAPAPRYSFDALTGWVWTLRATWGAGADGFVYFNNDPGAAAVYDAETFVARLEREVMAPVARRSG